MKNTAIFIQADYNGHKHAPCLLELNDFRVTTPSFAAGYTKVANVASVEKGTKAAANGHKYRVVTLEDGRKFGVFNADWSAFEAI